ncbi:MAG TPA: S8/S53 family peptidase [Ramlibacter sp.]|jgi:subtilisin family serine protease|uniref:S8 family peptidase n=1 Tax=Ramlibacter sp. TaxID=1917967 RepID=UPI002D702708|nr:S8/S53 family peptidase [Ramlibacter sp.]HZY18114.1 S8/S53 family peptidase [Ramlibacter sp.]
MTEKRYAKVVIRDDGPSFATYRQSLAALGDPGLDIDLLQVGVHEGLVRPHVLRHLVQRHPGTSAEKLLTHIGAHRVEFIDEADAQALARQRIEEDLEPRAPEAVPGAAGGLRWHLEAIRVDAAWAALGGPETLDWAGSGIRVGQIDTGYTRHRALGFGQPGGSWLRVDECRTFMPSATPQEFGLQVPAPNDDGVDPMPFGAISKGHGTRIGATLSGCATLPDGSKFYGVAPRVPHVVVRIADVVVINDRQEEFAQALRYLVQQAQVDVVNVSLGVFPPIASPAMVQAMQLARSRGVIVVCAAGNHVDPVVAPARLDTAIAVAGTTWRSLPWSGSSFGAEVAFSAPAANLFRPVAQRKGLGADYAWGGDGTSYAAAIASGCAALWLLRWKPQIDAMYGRTARRVEAFQVAAQATCRKPPGWQPTPFGAGILDAGVLCTQAAAALPALAGLPPLPATPAPVAHAAPAVPLPHGDG